MLNREAQRLANQCRQRCPVTFIGTIKVARCLVAIAKVVLAEAAIEKNLNRIVIRQTLQKLLVLAHV